MKNAMQSTPTDLNVLGTLLLRSEKKAASLSHATLNNILWWEQLTNGDKNYFESLSDRIRSQEARQKLLQYVENEKLLDKGIHQPVHRQQQISFLMKLYGNSASSMKYCGKWILIDQLLSKLAYKKTVRGIQLVNALLSKELKESIAVHPPLSIEPHEFIEQMLVKAEGLPFMSGAEQLKEAYELMRHRLSEAIHRSFPFQEGRIGGRQIIAIWKGLEHDKELIGLYRQLDEKWQLFTESYLKSKLLDNI